ncbi:hypothetical protein PENANT_c012G00992 [Penicillium antarcticum]|uniref:Vesicle transport protein n=1 Tax=Penicillium antarcticum TaxID=416450 RepID=A0A1V6Q765_9EURO|nr:hypothetical protein PENANT_c012G00992 [Penicillium antarcticum]
MAALHRWEKGNLAALLSIAQCNLSTYRLSCPSWPDPNLAPPTPYPVGFSTLVPRLTPRGSCMKIHLVHLVRHTPLQNLLLTLISSIFQLASLVWYLVSYFPMGSTGLQYMGRFGASRVTAWVSG